MLRISGGTSGEVREFAVGDRVTFGRCGGMADIAIGDDRRLHRCLGEIGVYSDGWVLRNLGRWLHLQVIAGDGSGRDSVQPGVERRVPWATARVEVRLGDDEFGFVAEHAAETSSTTVWKLDPMPAGEVTRPSFELDRSSGYYRALVALCAPGLRDATRPDTPTNAQIAADLNRAGREARAVTAKTVERRLAYCAQLFGLRGHDARSGAGLERRGLRAQLAGVALQTGTITAADLEVLRA